MNKPLVMNRTLALAAAGLALACAPALARGGGGHSSGGHSSGGRSSSHSSNPGAHHVSAYVTKRGTYVKEHRETNADNHFGNNWSTKGNVNPDTDKAGTRVTPPNGEPR